MFIACITFAKALFFLQFWQLAMFGNVLLFFAARAAARLRATGYKGRHQSVPACRPSVHSQAPHVRGQDGKEGC